METAGTTPNHPYHTLLTTVYHHGARAHAASAALRAALSGRTHRESEQSIGEDSANREKCGSNRCAAPQTHPLPPPALDTLACKPSHRHENARRQLSERAHGSAHTLRLYHAKFPVATRPKTYADLRNVAPAPFARHRTRAHVR